MCGNDCTTGSTTRSSNTSRGKGFFSSPKRQQRPWGPPSLPLNGCRSYFPQAKKPGHQVNHWHPSSTKTGWSYTFFLSFFLSFLLWHLLRTQYRCRRLLLHFNTLRDTHRDGRTSLDKWSAWSRGLYLTTRNTHKRQTCSRSDSNPQSERQQTPSLRPPLCQRYNLRRVSGRFNGMMTAKQPTQWKKKNPLCKV